MTTGTAPRTLLAEAFPDRPLLDMALSHALTKRDHSASVGRTP